MTTELFLEWKRKKVEERDAGLAAQRAERAKNDRMRFVSSYNYILPLCYSLFLDLIQKGIFLFFSLFVLMV